MINPFYSPDYYLLRSQFLLEVAKGKPDHVSEVYVSFSKPDYGWIYMDIFIDGRKKHSIHLSDVFDPSLDIINWLTGIISRDKTIARLSINEEGAESILVFEEYGTEMKGAPLSGLMNTQGYAMLFSKTPGDAEDFNNRVQLGLFTVYHTGTNSMPVKAIVSTRQLVSAIYLGLLSYAATFVYSKDEESFAWNWNHDEYDLDLPDYDVSQGQWDFYNTVKSPELEWYLYSDAPVRADLPVTSASKNRITSYIIMWAEWGDGLFWTTGGCCGNADRVYADGSWISLLEIAGLREWYDEFDYSEPCVEWEPAKERDWFERGRKLAFEVRKRLPKSVELFYYWLPFKHPVDKKPGVMDLIPDILIKNYKSLDNLIR